MKGTRANKPLIHLLLIVLQLTMLQWSMQVVAAVPGDADMHMAACDTPHHGMESGLSDRGGRDQHDCCAGHMSLDCQYHCSAGGFAFLGQAATRLVPPSNSRFPVNFITVPDSVSARTLFRPPRHFLAV